MDHHSDDGSVHTTNTNQSAQQGGNTKHELSIIEELDLKFGSAKNKHQILHALDHSSILHRIPLPTPNTTTEQARKDFRRERVLLNDVPFIPDKTDVDRCNAFSMTLNVLVERMMRRRELFDAELYPDVEAITDAVMQRACRTGAGADSFFMVQKLLCVEGTFVTQRTFLTDPPIKIDVFVADPASAAESSNSSSSSARKMATCRTGYSMESAGATVLSRAQRSASGATETAVAVRDTPAVPSSSGSRHSTPPHTPPHTRSKALTQEKYTNKSLRASPLKASLRNLGLMSKTSGSGGSGHPFPAVPETGGASDSPSPSPPQPPVGQGLGSSSSGVAFSPPSSPTASAVAGLGAVQNSNNSQSTSNIEASAARESSSFQSPASSSTADAAPTELTQQQQPCGAICARIQVMNSFAIYDVSAIEEITGVEGQDPDPWLQVEAIVVDETNFRTDQHWRKLQLIATCPASGKVYTSTPDAHSASRVSGRLSGRMVLRELKSWFTPLAPFSANNNNNHNLSGNSLLPQHGSARHTGKSSTQHSVPALSSPPATTAATAAGSSAPASTAASMSVGLPTSLTASSAGASHSWDGKSSSSSTQSGNVFAVSLGTNSPCLSVRVESGLSDSGDRFSSGSHTAVVNPHIQLRDAALTALMSPSPATSPRACDDPTVSVLMQLGARGLDDSALCTDSFSSYSGSLPGTDAAMDTGTDRGGSVLGDEASIGTADYNTGTEGGRLSAGSGGRSVLSGLPVRTIEELDLLMSSANMDEPGQFGSSAGLQSGSDDEAPADVSCSKGRVGGRKKVS